MNVEKKVLFADINNFNVASQLIKWEQVEVKLLTHKSRYLGDRERCFIFLNHLFPFVVHCASILSEELISVNGIIYKHILFVSVSYIHNLSFLPTLAYIHTLFHIPQANRV